uniref:Band 7 domain-containing protein n=1 Tax=Aureoumbra lagunensis TaxID=44058 RepID=A0A7S3K324_9STRA|mmetsp:Transcript_5462/g.8058  ORF Transcript_5462/g.8058 Transcript_5462/m.8058 type:complete len:410 (-) Transcript_5462:1081-2310(-)
MTNEQKSIKISIVNSTSLTLLTLALGFLAIIVISWQISILPIIAKIIINLICSVGIIATVIDYIRRWVSAADARSWLLLIENGELKAAGVGITLFRGFGQNVVTMPSTIHKVLFRADQVTSEMQGVIVQGFVMWQIYREGDGPFRAYKNIQSPEEGNENIARMAESILRAQVANMTIKEVIQNREQLRDKVRADMMSVIRGWGVWLETVEVFDIKVSSQSLFNDMQTKHRMETHRAAEQIRLAVEHEMRAERVKLDLESSKNSKQAETEKNIFAAEQALKQEQQQEKLVAEQQRIALFKLENDRTLKMKKAAIQAELDETQTKRACEIKSLQADNDLDILKRRIAVEATMSEASLRQATLQASTDIFKSIPLSSVKLVNCITPQGTGWDSLLPGLATISNNLQEQAASK